jgi:hypothetical protein
LREQSGWSRDRIVAWPVEYHVSGIKTFIVNQDGIIYEQDLGASASALAQAMRVFDSDKTWLRVR